MAGFTKAVRSRRKLKAAFDGVSGAGKTFSALRLAFSLVDAGMGSKVAVIDSESGSASLYANEAPDGRPWEYDCLELHQFGPDQYTAAINLAFKSGYDILVIDSLSHAWNAEGGALDMVDRKGGNKFTAWKDITPLHRRMVDAIINAPGHVIVTMRSKTEYVMETDDRGRSVPRKIGMAPVQRDGMEYEFDVYASIDSTQQIRISKSRCSAINGMTGIKPGPQFWAPLFDWLNSATASPAAAYAEEAAPLSAELLDKLAAARGAYLAAKNVVGDEVQAAAWAEVLIPFGVASAKKLSREQAQSLIEQLKRDAATAPQTVVETAPVVPPTPPVVAEPVATQPAALPPAAGAGPVTDDQKEKFLELRERVCASRGANTDDARREAWADELSEMSGGEFRSVGQMTSAQADTVIDLLWKKHVAF